MNRCILPLAALTLLVTSAIAVAQQGAVVIDGTTSYYRDRDDQGTPLPEAERSYQPLPGVRIVAMRRSVIGTDISRPNGTDAAYGLKIAEGAPFHVLFQEDKLVPDLKTLTADPKKPQHIHVTLLTRRQFEEIFDHRSILLTRISM